MESPESSADNTTATSAAAISGTFPDSAIFGDIDNLSPVSAVKVPHATPGFPGLSSPPIVFPSPHLSLTGESYSERFQCLPPFSRELCQLDGGGKKTENGFYHVSNYEVQSSILLTRCSEKECANSLRVDQFLSPTACIDKCLAATVEVDHEKPENLALNDSSNLKTKFVESDIVRRDAEKASDACPGIFELGGHDIQGNSSFDEIPVEADAKREANELLAISKHSRPELRDIADGVFEVLSYPSRPFSGYHGARKVSEEASSQLDETEILHDYKGQYHRGMQRRRLRFEEDQFYVNVDAPGSSKPSNAENNSRSPATLVDLKDPELFVSEKNSTLQSSQAENPNQPIATISFRICSNSGSTVSKPSGIGLHLNSIISSMPKRGSTCESSSLKARKGCPATSQGNEASDSHSPQFGPPEVHHASLYQSVYQYQATQSGKRKLNLDQACAIEELSQPSPKKKSKKALIASVGDGCKHCNCKKSRCLKLYCECFAAGIYCAESCSCQGCLNKPDYVDTVLETRQEVESRNPLAFAPKIVDHLAEIPTDKNAMGETDSTPSSARHKRGCNCKKSMCMKKYCECYQGNARCSSGCRCEGCQNIYGKKEDYHMAMESWSVPTKVTFDENVETLSSQNYSLHKDFYNHHKITPSTPSLQFSDRVKDASKSKVPSRRYFTSPESDLKPKSQESLESSDSPDKNRTKHIQLIKTSNKKSGCTYDDAVDLFSPTNDDHMEVEDSSRLLGAREQHVPSESSHLASVSSSNRLKPSCTTRTVQFGSARIFQASYEEKLNDPLESDTAEILKEDPLKAVKVSSPNKKRISPPHICGLRQLGPSISSAGQRSGRKFILRAVPSFPPLIPCIDAKDRSSRSRSDAQDISCTK